MSSSRSSRRHRPSGKHSHKEPWSAWREDVGGIEYRTRLREDGKYDTEQRPLQASQAAIPEDYEEYSRGAQNYESEERGRSWDYDPDNPMVRVPSTGSDKTMQPPPPKPPFPTKSYSSYEQHPRSTSSTPLDEYGLRREQSQLHNPSRDYYSPQPSNSTEYESGEYGSGTAPQYSDPFTASSSSSTGDYAYRAHADSDTPRYRK